MFEVDVVSTVPISERELQLHRRALVPDRLRLRQTDADYTAVADLRRLDPASYDNVVLVGSDWLESGEQSDARTILGYLLLRELLLERATPELLVELLDPGNVPLFDELARSAAAAGEVALGVRLTSSDNGLGSRVRLNPPSHERFALQSHDQVLILRTLERRHAPVRTERAPFS